LTANDPAPERAETPRAKTRLDQWLWFARFARSRSLAARLCTAGAVTLNGGAVSKPNQTVRVGDIVIVPQGGWQRTIRVLALGVRRGPASEARLLYEETAAALRLSAVPCDWVPLLDTGETEEARPPVLS
jgi:ribosome-associated heat shock protein Hsp15